MSSASQLLALLVAVLSELTPETARTGYAPVSQVPYTWGGKGWGGAGEDGAGYDCSGFAQGLYRRLGLLRHGDPWSSSMMAEGYPSVSSSRVLPLDLAVFGHGGVTHCAVVLVPGRQFLDAGGGGSATWPGGDDWPPARGRACRVREWAFRSDLVGFRRVPASLRGGPSDRALLTRWLQHVRAWRVGDRAALDSELRGYGYRPVYSGYSGVARA